MRVTRLVPEPGQDFTCHKGLFTQETFVAHATFSMERPAGRDEAQHPVKRHDKRAHSRETFASVLIERMHGHVETVGIDETHNKI